MRGKINCAAQISMFSWEEIEELGDLERLRLVIEHMKLITKLYDGYGIKPVIDIRNCWKDREETRQLAKYENVVYNYKGNVYCYCEKTLKRREMCAGGAGE